MTYQELMDVLLERNAAFTNMQPTSLQAPTIDQIISGIQSQYQQPAMQPMMPSAQAEQSFGASRFTDGPQTFSQQAFTPVANSGSSFKPSEFDIDLYRNIDDKTLSSLISQLGNSEGGGYEGSGTPNGLGVDDVGLATSSTVTPGTVQAIGAVLGILGVPGSSLIGMGKNAIASALTAAGYNSAVANNMAMVANSMGLNPNDPANFAAISSAIDSLSANNAGTSYATPGTSGTGGSAAQAAAAAAEAATAAGHSPAAAAAAAQAAANAVVSGRSTSEAAQIASDTAASASGGTTGPGSAAGVGVGSTTGINAMDAMSDAAASSSSPSSSKIVCTAMNNAYGFGSFRNAIWLKYAQNNLTKAHEAGYHAIFLPLVDFAYKNGDGFAHKAVRSVLENIARHRSADLRSEMRGIKRDNLGRFYRAILEPICFAVGKIKGY